jgi:hypothetical protein
MKFRVTSPTFIICPDCQGTTKVIAGYIYDTDDLACNCMKFDDYEDDEPTEKGEPMPENPNQGNLFDENPEYVINPDEDDMTKEEVREYLKGLKWPELLKVAKRNEVKKPQGADRAELERLIIEAVFYDEQ